MENNSVAQAQPFKIDPTQAQPEPNRGKAITGILQNTEEHALYLIQINERLDKLEKENKNLKQDRIELTKRIEYLEKL